MKFFDAQVDYPDTEEDVLVKSSTGRYFFATYLDGEWFELVDVCEYVELPENENVMTWSRDAPDLSIETNCRRWVVDIYNPPYLTSLVYEREIT